MIAPCKGAKTKVFQMKRAVWNLMPIKMRKTEPIRRERFWYMEFETIADLIIFVKHNSEYREIVLSNRGTEFNGIDGEIEIYDSWRE